MVNKYRIPCRVDWENEFIKFEFKNFEETTIFGFKVGDVKTYQGLHSYHDINGCTHCLIPYPNECEYRNNPYDGESYPGKDIYKIKRLSRYYIEIENEEVLK